MNEQLTYKEKIHLLNNLKDLYQNNYPDYSEKELWEIRSINIWFIIDVLKLYSDKIKEWESLTQDDIIFILWITITPDQKKEMTEWLWEENKEFLLDWLKETIWILLWKKEYIKSAKEKLDKNWNIFLKCSYNSIFDSKRDGEIY